MNNTAMIPGTESGSITVRAAVEEYRGQQLQLRFEVKDSGIGKEGPRYAVREMTEEKMVVWH